MDQATHGIDEAVKSKTKKTKKDWIYSIVYWLLFICLVMGMVAHPENDLVWKLALCALFICDAVIDVVRKKMALWRAVVGTLLLVHICLK